MLEKSVVCRLAAGVAMVLLIHGPAEAQTMDGETEVLPGDRVRVTFNRSDAEEKRLTGDFRELGPEVLRLGIRSSDTREIPLRSIVKLERRIEKGRKTRGALIGFGVGFSALFLLTGIGGDETCFQGGDECGLQITGSALFALPAAVVGALIAPGDKWAEVPLSAGPLRTSSSSRGLELRVVPTIGKTKKGLTLVVSF